jgi:hypothetical protein
MDIEHVFILLFGCGITRDRHPRSLADALGGANYANFRILSPAGRKGCVLPGAAHAP